MIRWLFLFLGDFEKMCYGNHGKYDGMGTGIEFAKSVDSADGTI